MNHLSAELNAIACQFPFGDPALSRAALQNGTTSHGSSQPPIG
jgi:hypothetical protein